MNRFKTPSATILVLGLTGVALSLTQPASAAPSLVLQQSVTPAVAPAASGADFYTPPTNIPATPGTLIKSEIAGDGFTLANGTVYRIMYTSLDKDGKPVAVTGLVGIPSTNNVNRPILSLAHGTEGPSVKSAPSESKSNNFTKGPFATAAMQRGWIVSAPDYQGLGVAGNASDYLVGHQEAADVVNGVRASRQVTGANAGTDWISYGVSQGGHAAAWSDVLAQQLAPELHLKGVGLAAPALQIGQIDESTWNDPYGWVIGSNAFPSWTNEYPDLLSQEERSPFAVKNAKFIASLGTTGVALLGKTEEAKKPPVNFWQRDPKDSPAIQRVAASETPPPPPISVPVFMAQGDNDDLVPPQSNKDTAASWEQVGLSVQTDYVAGATHFTIASESATQFLAFADQAMAK